MSVHRVRLGLGCLVLALVVIAGFVVAGRSHESLTATTLSAEPGAAPFTAEQPPVALIVGDSFAEGVTGVTKPNGGLARQFAAQMGWSLDLDAQGGTGYTAVGPVNRFPNRATYPVRMQRHSAAERVSYVVITGGGNDSPGTSAEISAGLAATVGTARSLWPNAKIFVVGPIWVHAQVPKGVLRIRNAIKDEAVALGLPFVDPVADTWTTPENEAAVGFTDGVHPSQAGHDYYATRLVQAFTALGVPRDEKLSRDSWFDPATTAS